jgi:hypothetical protein
VTVFSESELQYLTRERRLARIASVGRDGMPDVVHRIHPERIISRGLNGGRSARSASG